MSDVGTDALPVTITLEVRANSKPQDVAAAAVAAFQAAQPQPPTEVEQPADGSGWGIGSTTEVGVPGIRVFDPEQPTESAPAPPVETNE
jgi:hypothetical protein